MSNTPCSRKKSAADLFKDRSGVVTEPHRSSVQNLEKIADAVYRDRVLNSSRSTAGLNVFHEQWSWHIKHQMHDLLLSMGLSPKVVEANLFTAWECNVPLGAVLLNANGERASVVKSVDFLMFWGDVAILIALTKFPISDLACNKHTSYHCRSGEATQLRDANPSATVYSVAVVPKKVLNAKAQGHTVKEDGVQLVPDKTQKRIAAEDDLHFFSHFTPFTPDFLAASSKDEARAYVEAGGAVLADPGSVIKALSDDLSSLMPSIAQRIVEHVRTGAPLLTGKRRTAPTPSMLQTFRQEHSLSIDDAQSLLTSGDWAAYERDEDYMVLDTWRAVQFEQKEKERAVALYRRVARGDVKVVGGALSFLDRVTPSPRPTPVAPDPALLE